MNRKPVFDAVRSMMAGHLKQSDVDRLDAAIDEMIAGGEPAPSTPSAPTKDAFTAALDLILHHEGGYVNHPKDPGGRTNLGVTQRVWETWTGKPATEADMRALTREKVTPVYRKNYWDAVSADDLPGPLALCLFDMAVNAGPGRAARILQGVLGVAQDGRIGPATIAAAKGWNVVSLVARYQDARRAFYQSLATFPTFGKGWMRRVDEVEAAAMALAR